MNVFTADDVDEVGNAQTGSANRDATDTEVFSQNNYLQQDNPNMTGIVHKTICAKQMFCEISAI